MDRIERIMLFISRGAAVLGVLLLLMVAALSVTDIVIRELTGRPIRGAYDIAGLLTILIIAACFPAGLLERRQIKVTILGSFTPAWFTRIMEVVGALLTLVMFAFIAYYVMLHAERVSARAQFTMVLSIPIGPWWWAATICFWACIPAQLFVVVAEALGRPAADPEE